MSNTIRFFRTKKEALSVVASLSDTSKMPGKSWGISPNECKTGRKLAEIHGTVCSHCYAMKGFYVFSPAKNAHAMRLQAWRNNRDEWVFAMVKLISDQSYFRWFDAGDVQSVEMAHDIMDIAENTPETRHWVASREVAIWKAATKNRAIPENMVLRMSASFPDDDHVPGANISGNVALVHTNKRANGAYECPAPKQDGACGSCRACWNSEVKAVSYGIH